MSATTGKDKFIIGGDDGITTSIQPKLGYRFKVEFVGLAGIEDDTKALTGFVTSVTPPDFSQDEVAIDAYVSKFYVIGRHTIGDLTLELRNDINGHVARAIQAQKDAQYNANKQSHASTAGSVKFAVKIFYLDGQNGEGTAPRSYEGFVLTGCWIKTINWGQLQYSSSDPVQISVTIRPDNMYHVISDAEATLLDDEAISHDKSTVFDN